MRSELEMKAIFAQYNIVPKVMNWVNYYQMFDH